MSLTKIENTVKKYSDQYDIIGLRSSNQLYSVGDTMDNSYVLTADNNGDNTIIDHNNNINGVYATKLFD
jgi:hypothetical protein